MAQNSDCWISFVHYARENAGSKAKMVEIHVILGRNARISWNSRLASSSLVQKILQVWNFVAFLLQQTRQESLYLFQLMSGFSTIKMHNQRLTHAHESRSECNTYCVSIS